MERAFTFLDYVVLLGTILGSMVIGLYYGLCKRQKTSAEIFVGSRSMPLIPTSLSLLATYMSPILVLGYAGEIYSYGTLMVETIVGACIFVPLAALIFMPTLYPLKLTSAYEYLEYRFDSQLVKLLATVTFVMQIVMYIGVVIYAPAVALNAVVDFQIWLSVIAIGGTAAIYTSMGGLKAVVWTDVFQVLIMLAGMFAIVIEGTRRIGSLKDVYEIADAHNRIQFLNFEVNPFRRLNTLNIFFGNAFMVLSVCGCQQTTVQRYSSMSSLKKGIWSMMITLPLVVITVSLAALAGVVIFANYADCDPLTLGLITRNDQIAPHFVLEFLSSTNGLLGLFIACLFSASLSTVSSGLNSVSAVTWQDFMLKIPYFRNKKDKAQGTVTKIIGLVYGLIAIGMAFLAGKFDGVLAASIVLNGSVAGPLLGVFLLGILLPFTNKYGAALGVLAGHCVTIWIIIGSRLAGVKSPTLPFSIEKCSEEILNGANQTAILLKQNASVAIEDPEITWSSIYSVSFLLYPVIGCTVTVLVGVIVSLLTGCRALTPDRERYIHPYLVKLLKSTGFYSGREENFDDLKKPNPVICGDGGKPYDNGVMEEKL